MNNRLKDIAMRWQEQKEWALLALREGDYTHAEQLWQLALQDLLRQSEETFELVITLEQLGETLVLQNKQATAIPHFQRALRIRAANQGEAHEDVAGSMHRLARAHFQLRQYADAEDLLKRALEIYVQLLGPTDQVSLAVQGNIDLVHQAQSIYIPQRAKRLGWSLPTHEMQFKVSSQR